MLINVIAVFVVYGVSKPHDLLARILLGTDDFTMWYIPFILTFYLIFWIICKMHVSIFGCHLFLILCGVIWIGVGNRIGIGSQWYTSTAALILGCIIAEYDTKFFDFRSRNLMFVVLVVAFVGFAYLSRCFSYITLIKDITTALSGMVFSLLVFIISGTLSLNNLIKADRAYSKCVSFIGKATLWIYIIHMKIMTYFFKVLENKIFLFLIGSIVVAIATMKIYNIIKRQVIKVIVK